MRIALVSFWHLHGADYALEALVTPGVEIVSLCDEDEARGLEYSGRLGVPLVSFEDILEDPEIDGVVVCAPTNRHVDVLVRAARAGKHIFVEKVLADTLDGAHEIVEAADAAGVVLVTSMWRLDQGHCAQIADLISQGVVGDVMSLRVRDGHPFALPSAQHPDGILPPQFYDPVTARGGALIDLCHPLYLVAALLGEPERAVAGLTRVTGRGVEDNASVLLSYPGGALAVAETSYVTRIVPFSVEVHGTLGSIIYQEPGIGASVLTQGIGSGPLERPTLRVWSLTESDGWHELPVRPDAPSAFTQWVELASSGTRADANVELALILSALVEAAYQSDRQQAWASMPDSTLHETLTRQDTP